MLIRWKKLSSKVLSKNKYWAYLLDSFTIDGTNEMEYHYVHTLGSTMVVPRLNDGKFLMVNQYRYLNDKFSLEFPCGSIEENLTEIENAKKELAEETGFNANSLIKIGFFSPYNGVADEICTVFVGENLVDGDAMPDLTEQFELHHLTELEIDQKISKNEIWDGMTIAAWSFYKHYINKNR